MNPVFSVAQTAGVDESRIGMLLTATSALPRHGVVESDSSLCRIITALLEPVRTSVFAKRLGKGRGKNPGG
jgi:hypothetical protein